MDKQISNAQLEEASPVHRMFEGRSVFITGASGFIGRVLLEKLLRTYRGIRTVYILMRTKKNQPPAERLHKQLLKAPVFDHIRSLGAEGERLFAKIRVVPGDIGEPELGISAEDMRTLLEDESLGVVIHSAATIKFDEPLKLSVQLNLIATRTIIELCRRLPNLISLCHVSTAYVNSDIKDGVTPIEERLYPMRDEPEKLMQLSQLMDEQLMQTLKLKLVDQRPNTYTYTKALSEQMIAKEAYGLPVAIVRPSIVVAAWREPLVGWIDNLNGPTGLILAIGKGLLRSLYVVRGGKADMIPVDIVVNTMIAATYYAAKVNNKLDSSTPSIRSIEPIARQTNEESAHHEGEEEKCEAEKSEKEEIEKSKVLEENSERPSIESLNAKAPPIFHCTSGDRKPITWGDMEDWFFPLIRKYPSCQVLRYPFGTFKGNKYHDLLVRIFVHYLPALMIDLLCGMLGKKRQLLAIYHKLHAATGALSHFCTTNYNFKSRNIEQLEAALTHPRDQKELYTDIRTLDWIQFFDAYVLGARRYVLREEDHTLDQARKSFLKAYYIEIGLRTFLVLLLSAFLLPFATRLAASYNYPVRSLFHASQTVGTVCS